MSARALASSARSVVGCERLRNLWVDTPQGEPHEVVRHLGALQAQDYPSALLAIALRTRGASVQEVERAVRERRIVRSWPLRGTLQLAPAEDVRWLLALTAPRAIAASARRSAALDVDGKLLARCERLLAPVLGERVSLSRDEALQILERGGISTAAQRGYHLLLQLALRGVLCFGAPEGKQPTFALLDVWAPAQRTLARDEALATLAERYVRSRSPTTAQDFAYWAGLTITESRDAFAAVVRADRPEPSSREAARAHLLPAFDEYLLGYKDRNAVLAPQLASRVCPGANGMFKPLLVYDGQVVGTFGRSLTKTRMRIELEPFQELSSSMRTAFTRAATRYGALLGLEAALGG